MSLGLSVLTAIHVLISLIGIAAGFVVMFGWLTGRRLDGWTTAFLSTTILTSVTGFFFPYHHFLPSHALGIITLVVSPIACYALYSRRLAGGWRHTYVITASIALYLNVFVLVAQLFMKVPALKALAPTGKEGPFKAAQLAVLILFVVLTTFSAIRFRGEQLRTA